jgi:hypothetical protein
MIGKKMIFIGMFASMLFTGCTMMTVGKEKTYCQEHGADYSDAGVCDDPWTIYQNRHALSALAMGHCGCRKK